MLKRFLRAAVPALAAIAVVIGSPVSANPPGDAEFPREWFYDNDQQWAAHEPLLGKKMPKLELGDWLDKKNKLNPKKDFAGKVVVLDFWATWCGPCVASIPHNKEMVEKYGKEGMVFLAVCTAGGQENLDKIAAEHQIDYPCVKDPGEKSAKAFAVQYYPTYAVVDRAGKVRAIGLKPDKVEDVVKKLLAEPVKSAEVEK
jgi:thiol-disulfide isomerase/thioredoxin